MQQDETVETIQDVPKTPPSSTEFKQPMTTGARVFARLNKVLDSVEKPNFDLIHDEDLTFNTSTATAVGGGTNMTVLGEMSMLEDISRVGGAAEENNNDGKVDETLLQDGDFSFQVEKRDESIRTRANEKVEISFSKPKLVSGIKRARDKDEMSFVKRCKVATAESGCTATPATVKPLDTIQLTPPTSKRKKPVAVLTEIKKTVRKTATKKSPSKLHLASSHKIKMKLLSRSARKSVNKGRLHMTASKLRRQPRFTQSIKKPDFGLGAAEFKTEEEEGDVKLLSRSARKSVNKGKLHMTASKLRRQPRITQSIKKPDFGLAAAESKTEEDEEDVSPKTARRVQKSVTKSLSLSLRVSSTSSVDVEEFWRQLREDESFKNLKRKRFDGIIANLHNRNRCFVSNNVIHRI